MLITKTSKVIFFASVVLAPHVLSAQGTTSSAVIADAFGKADSVYDWTSVTLPAADQVKLDGVLGELLERGVGRLALPPYSTDWLLSDVSFKIKRIFTNYSGDVSGRFLELATLTSPPGKLMPSETLPPVLEKVLNYQKPDGHFGVDVDWTKPLKTNDAGITLLWGNARMLVGLVTAANELNDPKLMDAARRLGDFYVNTSDQLCSPDREAEYRATGTAADSYQVGYFPAIEALVMLYQATKDERYLKQAERMAAFFLRFDALPVDHSHGNLCAWRSFLDLYNVTGKEFYLTEALAKWDRAVDTGYVWSIGGVGEHWHINYPGSEGCSESDWLRFNLDLWRYTGQTRYLDMAERLLQNQYVADQTPNGGYGMRKFDGGASGPIATFGAVHEWDFCCSFHGPLGLHFLKSYLATGSKDGIYVNFPLNYVTPVKAAGRDWAVSVKTDSAFDKEAEKIMTVGFAAEDAKFSAPVTFWVRVPAWASEVRVDNAAKPAPVENGYIALKRDANESSTFVLTLKSNIAIEGRRFTSVKAQPGKLSRFKDISLVMGSNVLFEMPAHGPEPSNLLATVDEKGLVSLLRDNDGQFASVKLPDTNVSESQILAALDSGPKVLVMPWPVPSAHRTAFGYNLVVVPDNVISDEARARFAVRVPEFETPYYGKNLEKKKDLWPTNEAWTFKPEGILITGGNVGLVERQGYTDYRFEFDVKLPEDGQGITGWIVRAKDDNNSMMFQLQSDDSSYKAPEHKTRPNTLRPLARKKGQLTVADPVSLHKKIRRGETLRVATECRGSRITVFVDGEKVYEKNDEDFQQGSVGFRVSAPLDQGLFSDISLQEL